MEIELIILIIAYAVPMYFANAAPLAFFDFHSKVPLDLGKKFKGKRILGKGKTWLGTEIGILAGLVSGYAFTLIFPDIFLLVPNYLALAALLSVGAIVGDLAKSFLKRRIGIGSGELWLFADQLDFVVGGLLFSVLVRVPELELITTIIVTTVFIHVATNFAAFKMKIKMVPW